jgi:hypothetical protein
MQGPTALIIALHRGIYLANIMDHNERPQTLLNIALHRGLYTAVIMDRNEGPQTSVL